MSTFLISRHVAWQQFAVHAINGLVSTGDRELTDCAKLAGLVADLMLFELETRFSGVLEAQS